MPDPAFADKTGALIGLDYSGKMVKRVGVVRPEDKAAMKRAVKAAGGDTGRSDAQAESEPQSVRTDLTTYLTAVTQEVLADNPQVALRALAYTLASRLTGIGYAHNGVSVTLTDHDTLPASETLQGSAIEQKRAERRERWETLLPDDPEDLWTWCLNADDATIHQLLAYCTARSLTGTAFGSSETQIAPIVQALGIDPHAFWKPSAEYFRRIKKSVTLAVLAEHGHDGKELAKAKRDALAERAGDLLAESGWLPPSLSIAPVATA